MRTDRSHLPARSHFPTILVFLCPFPATHFLNFCLLVLKLTSYMNFSAPLPPLIIKKNKIRVKKMYVS